MCIVWEWDFGLWGAREVGGEVLVGGKKGGERGCFY